MGDDGAQAILDNAKAFAHLETLVLAKNYIPDALADRLAAAFGARVVLDDQNEEVAAGERYVQISE
jgi:hypothetical protein